MELKISCCKHQFKGVIAQNETSNSRRNDHLKVYVNPHHKQVLGICPFPQTTQKNHRSTHVFRTMHSTLQLQKSQNFLGSRGVHWSLSVFVSFMSEAYPCQFYIQIGVPNSIISPIPIHYLESFLPPEHITFGCPQKYSSPRWIVEIELHLSLEALLINKGDLLKWIGIYLCKFWKL